MDEQDPDEIAARLVAASMVGRTITAVEWFDEHPHPLDSFSSHEAAWVTLDDGRVIEFAAWSGDACGATIRVVLPAEQAKHAGQT